MITREQLDDARARALARVAELDSAGLGEEEFQRRAAEAMAGFGRLADEYARQPPPRRLEVLDVPGGGVVGTLELTDGGEVRGDPPRLAELVGRLGGDAAEPAEAFRRLAGWSNGYLRIVASDR